MSSFTSTPFKIISSELNRQGLSEFKNTINNVNIIGGRENAYIHKIIDYDTDVKNVVDNIFFHGFKFENIQADLNFKKSFITKFLHREIKFQTIDLFSSMLVSESIQSEKYINILFSDEIEKYLTNLNIRESENNTNATSTNQNDTLYTSIDDNRQITGTIPQNEINLDLNDDTLTFADTNAISKDKTENNTSNTSNSNNTNNFVGLDKQNAYNLESLQKYYAQKNKILQEFDKKLFLQIW